MDLELQKQEMADRQAHCTHYNADGKCLVIRLHCFPDRQPRGVCTACHAFIHPREWRKREGMPWGAKDSMYIHEAHPDYGIVLAMEKKRQAEWEKRRQENAEDLT